MDKVLNVSLILLHVYIKTSSWLSEVSFKHQELEITSYYIKHKNLSFFSKLFVLCHEGSMTSRSTWMIVIEYNTGIQI